MPRSQPRWVEAMKKPSRAGGKPAKARPHSALKPRGQNAPKPQSNRRSAADDSEFEVAQLKRELHEAVEQQTATAEILRVISSSPGDLQPVFEAILENATRICEAKLGNLWLREGDKFRIVAVYGGSPEYREYLFAEPLVVLDPQDATNRVVSDREVVQIDDISKAPTYGMRMRIATVKIAKARTLVGVPLLKDNEVVGIIAVYRQEVRPFTDKQIELVKNFAAQAVIAIENARLLNELRQRTAELTESLEQQTATSEVLQVISSSPGDLEPVFAAMLEKAVRICDATFGIIYRWDGDTLHLVAAHNMPPPFAEFAFAKFRRRSSLRPSPQNAIGRALATKMPVHVADLAVLRPYIEERDAGYVAAVELGGKDVSSCTDAKGERIDRLVLPVPPRVCPFTDKQIALITNFAAQASSPSRTRGCSTNCASPSGADGHVRGAQDHQQLSRRSSASVCGHAGTAVRICDATSEISTAGTVMPCTSSGHIIRHLLSLKRAGGHPFLSIREPCRSHVSDKRDGTHRRPCR